MERCASCHEERLGVNRANGMDTCGRASCLELARALEAIRDGLRGPTEPIWWLMGFARGWFARMGQG